MKRVIKNSVIFLLVATVLGGCLKNNDLYEGFNDLAPLADIPLSHLSSDTLTVYALPVAPSADATIDTVVAVHLSAKNHVGNVTFSLGVGASDSAFAAFMTAHPEYTLMPSNLYSFDSTVTITDAGVLNTATFPVRFKTATVDTAGNNLFLSNQYVLPIIIKDAGGYGIATNFRMIIMRVLAKNKYDGIYDLVISTTGWAAYGIADGGSNDWGDIGLATSGGSSVVFDYGAEPAFTTAGAATAFGATNPQFTFDVTTDKLIKVENLAPDDGRGRAFQINPAVTDSRFDPSTKTIYAAYLMFQIGRPTQYFYDTLTYKGPR